MGRNKNKKEHKRVFIVGFTGLAGSGKDTAGAVLTSRLGFTRFAFADPVKAALSAMFYWPPEQWSDRKWKESNFPGKDYSPRFLAQTLGTEWGRRTVDNNFWIDITESRIRSLGAQRVVITDVRFDNEARWIQRLGGWVIEIARPGAPAVNNHVSEEGVNPALIDFTLLNHGPKENFEAQIEREVFMKLPKDFAV